MFLNYWNLALSLQPYVQAFHQEMLMDCYVSAGITAVFFGTKGQLEIICYKSFFPSVIRAFCLLLTLLKVAVLKKNLERKRPPCL